MRPFAWMAIPRGCRAAEYTEPGLFSAQKLYGSKCSEFQSHLTVVYRPIRIIMEEGAEVETWFRVDSSFIKCVCLLTPPTRLSLAKLSSFYSATTHSNNSSPCSSDWPFRGSKQRPVRIKQLKAGASRQLEASRC